MSHVSDATFDSIMALMGDPPSFTDAFHNTEAWQRWKLLQQSGGPGNRAAATAASANNAWAANSGARIADDHFCSVCGARGYRGVCTWCERL